MAGAYLVALWFGVVIWTARDIRARSQDFLAVFFALSLVIVLNFAGLILYFILRPRDTLNEKYERSLEEEALLREAGNQLACPKCQRPIEPGFVICPHCRTQLKQSCPSCRHPLPLSWGLCPYCGAEVPQPIPSPR